MRRNKWSKCIFILVVIGLIFWECNENISRNINEQQKEENNVAKLEDGRYIFIGNQQMETQKECIQHVIEIEEGTEQKIKDARSSDQSSPFQTFYITRQKNGYYSIVSIANWKYLSTDSGGQLCQTADFNGDKSQLWYFEYLGKNWYTMENAKTGYLTYKKMQFITDKNEKYPWIIERISERSK